MQYVDIVLPLPLNNLYTYAIPESLEGKIQAGSRVIVQFGKKKFYTGIVLHIKEDVPEPSSIKEIITLLDDHPIVSPLQLQFWEWISYYYICPLGDVYKAALPSALKLESETFVILNPDFEAQTPLTPNEQKIFHQLAPDKALRISEIEKLSGLNNIIPVVKSLVDKNAAYISEDIRKDYTPKTTPIVRFAKKYSEEELSSILDSLQRAKKQQHLLTTFLHLGTEKNHIHKKTLLEQANTTPAVLNELIARNILAIEEMEISRINYGESNLDLSHQLNEYQQDAYKQITNSFLDKDITLLHGVTSSGKTEIYIQLIKDTIKEGKQVLYLLPEIALTTQITDRLKSVFGNKMAVYHSKFNDNERAEIWNKLLLEDECQVILGARSSIFLPFQRLGLIIVDEEHESSYKQQDPSPRYNARNAAIVLASISKAKVLLGSATPAIETYYNAISGKYGLVTLSKRYDDIALPHIEVVNTKELRRKKQMKSILSPPLGQSIKEALDRDEQIILFQNRRGFASMIECKTCSWTKHCTHCDVSLTYHKGQRMMICHYCGATYDVPSICPECQTPTLDIIGYGTERIEEEVQEQFASANIARMDLDTTRSRRAYERIIGDFENNKTNILIGTQMVSKGLDFDNVSIVGILNADNMLNYPDFRAHERAFQLITQVSGRAGRKNKQGHVFLQTSHPSHPIITFAKNNDYQSFYNLQIDERRLFRYPPFFRLIAIVLRGKDERTVENASVAFAQHLRRSFGERVLGPVKPPVSRIQSLYIRKILLKIENQASVQDVRSILIHYQDLTLSHPDFKGILLHYDVDPM